MGAALQEEVVTPKYITMQVAMERCEAAGMKMNMVTLLRIGRERNFLYQPRGKFGKCWLEEEAFEHFLKNG